MLDLLYLMWNYILPGYYEPSKNYKLLLKTRIEIMQDLSKLTCLAVSLGNSDGLLSIALVSKECWLDFILTNILVWDCPNSMYINCICKWPDIGSGGFLECILSYKYLHHETIILALLLVSIVLMNSTPNN